MNAYVKMKKVGREPKNESGHCDKFYDIIIEGSKVLLRFGRNGNEPRKIQKVFNFPYEAKDFFTKKYEEKKRKGYETYEIFNVDFLGVPGPEKEEVKVVKPEVKLVGEDGNVFVIIGACCKALKKAGQLTELKMFQSEAMFGDYDNVLRTAMKYCEVS